MSKNVPQPPDILSKPSNKIIKIKGTKRKGKIDEDYEDDA